MAFRKQGLLTTVGVGEFTGSGLREVLHRSAAPSDYLDGARSIDVEGILKEGARRFAISDDPRDYIYEAMRACTAQPPNENHDAFSKMELLRYDLSRAQPVYASFIGKPHHLNHRCFVEGTPVVMADGTSKPIEQVAVGDEVLDRTGAVQTVTDAWNEGKPESLTRLKVKGYGELVCTPHHKFPVWTWPRGCSCSPDCAEPVKPGKAYAPGHYKGGPTAARLAYVDGSTKRNGGARRVPEGWEPYRKIPASEIQPGDYLYIPIGRSGYEVSAAPSPEHARLLGYFVAEGCRSYKGTALTFGAHEAETWLADASNILVGLGAAIRVDPDNGRGASQVRTIKGDDSKSFEIQSWLEENGGNLAHGKRLSPDVMAWRLADKEQLIRGMFRGDGSQHYRNVRQDEHVYPQFIVAYTTVSSALASQVRMLLTEFAIPSTLEATEKSNIIRVHGQYARDLAALVWGVDALGQELQDSTAAGRIRREGSNLLVPVQSVEEVPGLDRAVFNLTVSGDHSYLVAGGLATFNTENPLAARGIILDAHFNDRQAAADTCPRCGNHTKEAEGRDASGMHCKACGHLVKDAFVEILVAVDSKKDPFFAHGVKTGQLDAGSMGCNCLTTTCNVCGHVAHSKHEFCSHIRGANKGTLWVPDDKRGWKKISEASAMAEMKRAGLATSLEDFCFVKTPKLEIRKAYEYCDGVEFDEYSRVYQPADRKARTTELLRVAQIRSEGVPTPEEMRRESEALLQATQMQRAMDRRVAQAGLDAHPEPVADPGPEIAGSPDAAGPNPAAPPADPNIGDTTGAMPSSPGGQEGFFVAEGPNGPSAYPTQDQAEAQAPGAPVTQIQAPDEAAAVAEWRREMTARRQAQMPGAGLDAGADNVMVVTPPPGVEVLVDTSGDGEMPEPGLDEVPMDAPMEVDPNMQDGQPGGGSQQQMTPNEMGIIPPGASAPWRYSQWKTARVGKTVTVSDPSGRSVMQVQASDAAQVKKDLVRSGLLALADKYNVKAHKKVSQILDGAEFAMDSKMAPSPNSSGISDGGEVDHQEGAPSGVPNIPEGGETDMQDDNRGSPPDSVHGGGQDAFDRERPDRPKSMTDGAHHTQREQPGERPKSMLDGEEHDHTESLTSRKAKVAKIASQVVAGMTVRNKTSGEVFEVTANKETPKGYIVTLKRANGQTRQVALADLVKRFRPMKHAQNTQPARPANTAPKQAPAVRSAGLDERQQKLFQAKLAKAKEAMRAELEEEMNQKLANFQRALYIVAARQDRGLLPSELKQALFQHLTAQRAIGSDPFTGERINWEGLPADVAQHLVASAWNQARGTDLESLVREASKFVDHGEQFMLTAEKDLRSLPPPEVPAVTSKVAYHPDQVRALEMRAQAAAGNVAPRSVHNDYPAPGAPALGTGREAVRAALSNTKVGQLHAVHAR